MLESHYFFHLKRKNMRNDINGFGRIPIFFTFEEWLENSWQKPDSFVKCILDHGNTIDLFCSRFGVESVKPLLFEEFAASPRKTIAELFSFMHADPAEANELLSTARRANDRWSVVDVDLLKKG